MQIMVKNKKTASDLDIWFIRQRWIACLVSLFLIYLVIHVLNWLDRETFFPLLSLVALMGLSNVIYYFLVKKKVFLLYIKESQIVVDLLILTLMLHYSGGIENSLFFLYLFHVILSGILLTKTKCYAVVALSFILFTSLALLELNEVIPHYTLKIFPHSEINSPEKNHDESEQINRMDRDLHNELTESFSHASHHPVYVWSIIFLALMILLLTAFFFTNIMDRLRHEEKNAHEGQQRLAHVLRATAAGFLILNKKLYPFQYNEPIAQWFATGENSGNNTLSSSLSEWIENTRSPAEKTLKDGIIRSLEHERVNSAGQKQFFQVTIAPLTDADGINYQVVELIQDITEKKKLETEMIHAAKIVTLGTMAAGIAHEIGNPLTSISTRLHLLESNKDQTFFDSSVGLLQKEIGRIGRIVRGVSQLGRPSKMNWGDCNINKIILETIEILKYHKDAKYCKITTELAEKLPTALGVSDQLNQVFLNLGLNAVEAMNGRGDLTIKSAFAKGYLKIEFIDNGKGVAVSDKEKIFQPFFTVKEEGGGLGLFIVNHIIQAHGGHITLTSKPNVGSHFVIHLPVHGNSESQKKGAV
ncbi:MAG: hypothetical protein DWQ05_01325 [Calditrichaeota bacterium]|nr:MAG: hypothetical protein DWQ05_01325 [Calditrichota bacterium]